MTQKVSLFIIVLLLAIIHAKGTQLVPGPAKSPFTFDSAVAQKVYCRAAGALYVGLSDTKDTTTIWRAMRPIGTGTPSFSSVSGTLAIQYLTLVSNIGNAMPFLGYVNAGDVSTETIVHAINYNGSNHDNNTTQLNDATGNPTTLIAALAGMLLLNSNNKGFVFAAVSPSGTDTAESVPFGQANSGIAVVRLNGSANPITLYQTAADPTSTQASATRLDPSTPQIGINANPEIGPLVKLHWDDQLQRLYCALELDTATGTGNGALSVVVAQVQDTGALELYNITAATTLNGAGDTAIVGVINSDYNSRALGALNIKTMHCSTGPSYLIVYGGVTIHQASYNELYALPLVDICPQSSLQGTLANSNAPLSYRHTFVVPATAPADLALAGDPRADIGAGPLPIQASTTISDIEVIGDTVYVSIATGQSGLNDNGIFYSQALFDATGKIARWTPWTKRAFPVDSFLASSGIDNGIAFFAVDGVTGKVWAVDGETQKVVRITAWDKGSNCTLPACLCTSLPCGCYSVLDLDQATRGFTAPTGELCTLNRFALFGGCGKVIFARTSYAYTSTLSSPQTIIEDFCPSCTTLNYLETQLPYPDTTVCINVLEYSRANDTNPNQCYFFAGTDNGLYVYALTDQNNERSNPRGFNLNGLDLNALSLGQWVKVSAFPDPIIDIKTTGLSLYIVSRSVTNGTMTSNVSRIAFQDRLENMFDESNIFLLAQSGTDPFENALAFTGIQPAAVTYTLGTPGSITAEQLLLATNDGLFGSNAIVTPAANGIASADNQTDADWQRVPAKNRIWFEGIAGIDTPIPSTVWPISAQDLCGLGTYENSWIYQISSNNNNVTTGPFWGKFAPSFFNAITRTPAFENVDPITYFWSDGARRFFIINRQQDPETVNRLMSFPYNTTEWRVGAPGQSVLLFDPYVNATKRFFWIKQIGVTGILMAGTNAGVIALE